MRGLRREGLIIGGFVLVVLLLIGRNPLLLLTHYIGSDTSDTYEMVRNVWWFTYALQQGEPLIYQTFMGYPDGFTGIVFTSVIMQYLPMTLLALFVPLPVAYNLTVIVYMALNGWAMVWLMRYLLDDRYPVAAGVAGLVYAAAPIFQGHLLEGHAGLLLGWPVPLFLWALLNLLDADQRAWRWFVASVGLFFLCTTGHILQVIYVLFPLMACVFLHQLWRRDWRAVRRVVGVGVVSLALTGALLLPAISDSTSEQAYVSTGGAVRYSADALAVVTPSFFNPAVDAVLDYPRRVLGTNLGEGSLYIGVLVGGLALIGLLAYRQARWWGLVAFIAWVLSLGPLLKIYDAPVQLQIGTYPSYIVLPFALLQNLPGFDVVRSPARFGFALIVALAVLAGYGMAWLWRNRQQARGWHRVAVALLVAGILWEYTFFWGIPLRPAAVPPAVTALSERDDVRAVFNVPYQHLLAAKDALYLQTQHQTPIIAGQVTRVTPVNPAKLALLQQTLNPALLQETGADVVIFHAARAREIGMYDTLNDRLRAQLGAPYYEDARIALYNVPESGRSTVANLPRTSGQTATVADLHLYHNRATWIDVRGALHADDRRVQLRYDGLVIHEWDVAGTQTIDTTFYVQQAGYHTATLALDPPCPTYDTRALACRDLTYEVSLSASTDDVLFALFDGGIALRAGDVQVNEQAVVRLHWQFDQARSANDVRFVHVVDQATGAIVVQDDHPLGAFAGGDQHAEILRFALADLPAGDYQVRVGWYRYDNVRETFSNYRTADGDGAFVLGAFSLP